MLVVGGLPSQRIAISAAPRPIQCGAPLADGSECQESATVTNAKYVYDRTPVIGGSNDLVRREVHLQRDMPQVRRTSES